ncbi:MAG: c-type cytochrome [Saprospiraceae bacterium]|nr:c-type cytochrome [Saprospiraceae bacterium]
MKGKLIASFLFIVSCQISLQPFKEGKLLYNHHCANCHGLRMEGLAQLYPSLSREGLLIKSQKEIICLVKYGSPISQPSKEIKTPMPSNEKLSEIQLCNLINYLYEMLQIDSITSLQEVQSAIQKCNH